MLFNLLALMRDLFDLQPHPMFINANAGRGPPSEACKTYKLP